jgi:hypothetical protein
MNNNLMADEAIAQNGGAVDRPDGLYRTQLYVPFLDPLLSGIVRRDFERDYEVITTCVP